MQTFPLSSLGHVSYWLAAGPKETLYNGPQGDEDFVRQAGIDSTLVTPPTSVTLGEPGPFGIPWRFHYPGSNFFCEFSTFYHRMTCVDIFLFTELVVEKDGLQEAFLWVAESCDFWLNGQHLARFFPGPRYYPSFRLLSLPLKAGKNNLYARLQCVGIRDTRILTGLQFKNPQGITVHIPGGDALPAAVSWLDHVRTEGVHDLIAASPTPEGAEVLLPTNSGGGLISLLITSTVGNENTSSNETRLLWPKGTSTFSLKPQRPYQLGISVNADEQRVTRSLEIPANQPSALSPKWSSSLAEERRTACLEAIAVLPFDEKEHHTQHQLPLLARRLLKKSAPHDKRGLELCIEVIDHREDCADFRLAGLLRMEKLGFSTPEESSEIRRAALNFRYWPDEPGQDAMCFGSENHSLLFHGCQIIAGQLYPDATFPTSQRTGREQATLALTRIKKWLDTIGTEGLHEFHSGTYQPITVGALLNVIDFCGDEETARRASGVLDQIFKMNAGHVFKGVVSAPQGRVYRNVLYPEESGTQSLMACLAPGILMDDSHVNNWAVYLCCTGYKAPENLDELTRKNAVLHYRVGTEGGFEGAAPTEIALTKTDDYLLSSVAVPLTKVPAETFPKVLFPGHVGYQQHLWQATLDRGCHIFVNHPGCSMDQPGSRPGYWYGNGILPRMEQKEGMLFSIFDIPDGPRPWDEKGAWPWPGGEWACDRHPISFTHAHWPTDAFDLEEKQEHWLFGQKGNGTIALWCSLPLEPYHDVLSHREYRALGYRCAWLTICGSAKNSSFEEFIESCLARSPSFDENKLTLCVEGEKAFSWAEGFAR